MRIRALAVTRIALGVLLARPAALTAQASPIVRPVQEETFRISVGPSGQKALLRHLAPAGNALRKARSPVLFVHGATFPSALAAAFRFDGVSWMDALSSEGFDVWALDFIGYGGSDRYPAMREPPASHPPLGRAPEAARQVAAAVTFIRKHVSRATGHAAPKVSLVAHSWGTLVAGVYVADHEDEVDRLVQFGPIASRNRSRPTEAMPAYEYVTEQDQRARFYGYVPPTKPPVLDPAHFASWGPEYMTTDPASHLRTPASVAVPAGPDADIAAAWNGHLPYDPAKITVPVLIVRGEWDTVCTDADARWLYDALSNAAIKRDVKIDRATHVMHLESSRFQLYRETETFLGGGDEVLAGSGRTGS